MLEGNLDALAGIEVEEISGEHIKEAIGEIERYRKDMITEHCTGYEADIEACTSLIEELSEWYGQGRRTKGEYRRNRVAGGR